MAAKQASLFESELPEREPAGLLLVPQPDRPLSKAQRSFNRLIAQIESLRAHLDREVCRLDQTLAYYGEHLHWRLQRENALRKDLVRAFAPFLRPKRLKRKKEKQVLRTIIAEQLNEIIATDGSLTDSDLQVIFEKVYGVDFEQVAEQEMADTRLAMEEMFGDLGMDVDLSGLGRDMSQEEFAAYMAQQLHQKAEQEEQSFHEAERPKSKRQLAKEERMRQAEELRKKSIASIYKQLAKVLHPDLEPDAERRQGKVALMQELTAAYRSNDLHTLLRLELEWIQRESGDLARLTDEKLRVYNELLKEQVAELEFEIEELYCRPRYQPIAQLGGPFEIRMEMDGPLEARQLDESIASMETIIARMRTAEALEVVRGAIQTYDERLVIEYRLDTGKSRRKHPADEEFF